MKPRGDFTRRDFLAGVALTAGSALTPEAFAQSASKPTRDSSRFSIAGAEVEFCLMRVSDATLRISVVAKGSGLDPRTAFPGFGVVDRTWPAVFARLGRSALSAAWGKRQIVLSAESADTERARRAISASYSG